MVNNFHDWFRRLPTAPPVFSNLKSKKMTEEEKKKQLIKDLADKNSQLRDLQLQIIELEKKKKS